MTERHQWERLGLPDIVDFRPARSIPLAGIGWIIVTGPSPQWMAFHESDSADAIRIFYLNAFLELRDRGSWPSCKRKRRDLRRTAGVQSGLRPEKDMASHPFPRTLGTNYKRFRTLHPQRQRPTATCPLGIASCSFLSPG